MPTYGKVKVNTLTYDSSGSAVDLAVGDIAPKTDPTFSGTITGVTAALTGNLTVDTNTLHVDATNNQVLIGRTSTNTSYPLCVEADSNAENILVIGRNSDDISEIGFFENDTTTRLGEIQYRQDHVNFRHRVGEIRFASGGSAERFRFGTAGQLGIGGATYGTSGHVLTSGGPSAAPSWAAPASGGGGLTEIDAWCLTGSWPISTGAWSNQRLGNAANVSGTGTFGRNSEHNMPIGTGVTNTNGLFTFPSTGTWEVTFQCYLEKSGSNYADVRLTICNTNATGGGETLAETSTTITANDHYHAAMSMTAMFKVTNTTNNNVWVRLNADVPVYIKKSNYQHMIFKKLT